MHCRECRVSFQSILRKKCRKCFFQKLLTSCPLSFVHHFSSPVSHSVLCEFPQTVKYVNSFHFFAHTRAKHSEKQQVTMETQRHIHTHNTSKYRYFNVWSPSRTRSHGLSRFRNDFSNNPVRERAACDGFTASSTNYNYNYKLYQPTRRATRSAKLHLSFHKCSNKNRHLINIVITQLITDY